MVVHLGAVGDKITLDIGQSLSGATKIQMQVIKPDGSTATWNATAESDTSIRYVTQSGDLDVAGRYLLISYVEWGSISKHLGDGFVLPVYPKTYQAASYTGQPATRKIDAVRALIGKSRSLALITDDEIDYQLSRANSNEILAAAFAAEQIAGWYADKVDKSMGGSSVSMSQKAKQWQDRADALRSQAMHTSITPRATSSAGRAEPIFLWAGITSSPEALSRQDRKCGDMIENMVEKKLDSPIPGPKSMTRVEKMTLRQRRDLELTRKEKADNESLFWATFKHLIKQGEPAPFASMMAERTQLQDLNRLLGRYKGPVWLPDGVEHYASSG